METLLLHYGINPSDVFAAFAGGVCAALIATGSKPNPMAILSSIVVGTCVGAYGGPVLPLYIGAKPSGFASFCIGAGGMPICSAIIKGFSKVRWSPVDQKIEGTGN